MKLITILAQVVSAEQLGIATEVMAVLLLAMWGVTTALSPLSAVTLFASRMAEISPWTLAWRWNLPMALAAAVIVAIAAIALSSFIPR